MTAKKGAPAKKAPRKASPAKVPAQKPKPREPETKPRSEAEQDAYEQGRRAQRSSIARRDAPHGKGALREAWRAGWDFQSEVAF